MYLFLYCCLKEEKNFSIIHREKSLQNCKTVTFNILSVCISKTSNNDNQFNRIYYFQTAHDFPQNVITTAPEELTFRQIGSVFNTGL